MPILLSQIPYEKYWSKVERELQAVRAAKWREKAHFTTVGFGALTPGPQVVQILHEPLLSVSSPGLFKSFI